MIKIERIVNNLKFVPKMYMELAKYSGTKRIYRRIVINNYILIYTVDDLNHKVYISHFYYGGSDYINRI